MASKVNWYDKAVMLVVENATHEMLYKLALRIEARASINIVNNDQVDTGFMLNALYSKGSGGPSGYVEALAKSGSKNSDAEMAPEAPLPSGSEPAALVAAGASYSIYQEMLIPFLYPAVEFVAQNEAEAVIKETGAKHFG